MHIGIALAELEAPPAWGRKSNLELGGWAERLGGRFPRGGVDRNSMIRDVIDRVVARHSPGETGPKASEPA